MSESDDPDKVLKSVDRLLGDTDWSDLSDTELDRRYQRCVCVCVLGICVSTTPRCIHTRQPVPSSSPCLLLVVVLLGVWLGSFLLESLEAAGAAMDRFLSDDSDSRALDEGLAALEAIEAGESPRLLEDPDAPQQPVTRSTEGRTISTATFSDVVVTDMGGDRSGYEDDDGYVGGEGTLGCCNL